MSSTPPTRSPDAFVPPGQVVPAWKKKARPPRSLDRDDAGCHRRRPDLGSEVVPQGAAQAPPRSAPPIPHQLANDQSVVAQGPLLVTRQSQALGRPPVPRPR